MNSLSSSLAKNPKYKLEKQFGEYSIYIPVNATDYHITRHIEAMKHNIYASAGITKERLTEITDAIIERCNKDNQAAQWRTDIGNLCAYLQACMKYPVDEHCAIRLGACLTFIEHGDKSENPDQPEWFFQKMKEDLAFADPDAYGFFLTWGIVNSDEYRELSEVLTDSEYFSRRREMLHRLAPFLKR